MTRLFAVLAALLLLACTGGSDSQLETPTASAEWSHGTPEAVAIPGLPPGLPIPAVEPEGIEDTAAGGVVVRWSLPGVDAGASAADLAREARSVPGVTVLAAELAATGGLVAFEAERDGHYVVTVDPAGEGTVVELWLDPAPTPVVEPPPAVALPDGYPADVLPVFPGATVTEAALEELGPDRERFAIVLVTSRAAIEVLGFYADHLEVEGWTVTASDSVVEAARGPDTVRVEIDDQSSTTRLTLEWTPPS